MEKFLFQLLMECERKSLELAREIFQFSMENFFDSKWMVFVKGSTCKYP